MSATRLWPLSTRLLAILVLPIGCSTTYVAPAQAPGAFLDVKISRPAGEEVDIWIYHDRDCKKSAGTGRLVHVIEQTHEAEYRIEAGREVFLRVMQRQRIPFDANNRSYVSFCLAFGLMTPKADKKYLLDIRSQSRMNCRIDLRDAATDARVGGVNLPFADIGDECFLGYAAKMKGR